METKWRSNKKEPKRSVSSKLLDFVFGEPLPQPEVLESNDEQAWQDWLNALADKEAVIEFEDTVPSSLDDLLEERPAKGEFSGHSLHPRSGVIRNR